jgi:nucleotide-binding universal stress UspA family protein
MKIFVPTDFSEGSKKAVHFAAQLAENFGAHMILAHAWYPSVTDAEFDNFNAVVTYDVFQKAAEEAIEGLANEIDQKYAIDIMTESLEGLAGDVIPASIHEHQPDLIIMGSRGMGMFGKAVLGSIAQRVIDKVIQPVLIVPPTFEKVDIEHITFASDFHDNDTSALKLLAKIGNIGAASINVLHFDTDDTDMEKMETFMRIYESSVREEVPYPALEFELIQQEDLIQGMDDYLAKTSVDLIGVSSTKKNVVQRFFNPSLTRHVLEHLKVPVLVFTAKDDPTNLF